jgi:hypothetical protein
MAVEAIKAVNIWPFSASRAILRTYNTNYYSFYGPFGFYSLIGLHQPLDGVTNPK